jgi:hypothetical protein
LSAALVAVLVCSFKREESHSALCRDSSHNFNNPTKHKMDDGPLWQVIPSLRADKPPWKVDMICMPSACDSVYDYFDDLDKAYKECTLRNERDSNPRERQYQIEYYKSLWKDPSKQEEKKEEKSLIDALPFIEPPMATGGVTSAVDLLFRSDAPAEKSVAPINRVIKSANPCLEVSYKESNNNEEYGLWDRRRYSDLPPGELDKIVARANGSMLSSNKENPYHCIFSEDGSFKENFYIVSITRYGTRAIDIMSTDNRIRTIYNPRMDGSYVLRGKKGIYSEIVLEFRV